MDASSATNSGQWQADFQVVIAGSNAYNVAASPLIPGYGGVQNFGVATIDAPANTTTYSKHLRTRLKLLPGTDLLTPVKWA